MVIRKYPDALEGVACLPRILSLVVIYDITTAVLITTYFHQLAVLHRSFGHERSPQRPQHITSQ